MILTSVPRIMVNHDLARLAMIMASVSWLRELGICTFSSMAKYTNSGSLKTYADRTPRFMQSCVYFTSDFFSIDASSHC